ncbi:PhzF family phenazine biosynthesis protein [Sinobacterium caligoides]|uniref:PhzF family phenazine biosynthesis protein n=1 Tax=Sinobacterium caligoides TaxID=933926 RepID=A0A3N2DPK3_9GAMM|nr:PhzF family phenazine biosynthesis protein [Sinobacterium caligoides]ROS01748.1 PhzF family phenazine biosynthesis protein [Sinobacterium caligoides]
MQLKMQQVDAFTDELFKGNSAAVIVLQSWLDEALMQSIAIENNLSETAFARQVAEDRYELRWFSPITEIAFCGHATLATAFVLFGQYPTIERLCFSAPAVGEMIIQRGDDGLIDMDFPHRPPTALAVVPEALRSGLSIAPVEVLRNEQAYFVIYDEARDVREVEPDLALLRQLAPYDVVVTAAADDDYDFISRYFWPASGGGEDPVTGSIHTGLAPLWAERLDKTELLAYQASQRGGKLHCRVGEQTIRVSGRAVLYLEGVIEV